MSIGTDTTMQGGREIRDTETSDRALDADMAFGYGDRVHWRDGYGPTDLPNNKPIRVPGGKLEWFTPSGESYLFAHGDTHEYLLTIDEGHTILSQYERGKFDAKQRWRRKGSWNADAMQTAEKWEAES